MSQITLHIWQFFDHRTGNQRQIEALSHIIAPFLTDYKIVLHEFRLDHDPKLKFLPAGILPPKRYRQILPSLVLADYEDKTAKHLILSAGGRTAPYARKFKQSYLQQACLVQILDPKWCRSEFDLIVIPEHDCLSADNIFSTMGALALEPQNRAELSKYKTPITMILIGGENRYFKMGGAEITNLLSFIDNYDKGTLLISTSRRTPQDVITLLKNRAKADHVHLYNPKIGENAENPYHKWLAISQKIIVTGDSISMIGEALSYQKPLYILRLPLLRKFTNGYGFINQNKFLNYQASLVDAGIANYFEDFNQDKGLSNNEYSHKITKQNQTLGLKILSLLQKQ